jgi:hypothetical protein
MANDPQPERTILEGPPIGEQVQQLFGHFAPGLEVTGILVYPWGLEVAYDDGAVKRCFFAAMPVHV